MPGTCFMQREIVTLNVRNHSSLSVNPIGNPHKEPLKKPHKEDKPGPGKRLIVKGVGPLRSGVFGGPHLALHRTLSRKAQAAENA